MGVLLAKSHESRDDPQHEFDSTWRMPRFRLQLGAFWPQLRRLGGKCPLRRCLRWVYLRRYDWNPQTQLSVHIRGPFELHQLIGGSRGGHPLT